MLDENNKDCLIWDDSWGWWRWCDGSNIEFSPTHTFKINGNDIELYYDECEVKTYASYILNEENDDYWPEEDLSKIPESIVKDYFEDYGRFNNIYDYCLEIWGASTEKNRVAIIVANAKLNNMPIDEFMLKTIG